MKSPTRKSLQNQRRNGLSVRDALRVMIALIGILFASIASVDREAAANNPQVQNQQISQAVIKTPRLHPHSTPRSSQPSLPILQRINGSM